MKKVENEIEYLNGETTAEATIKFIDKTVYRTLEGAIKVKQELIDNFEKSDGFAYTREIPKYSAFDRNYAFNCGMLDRLKKELNGTKTC